MEMNNLALTGSGGSGFDGEMVPLGLNNKDDEIDSRSGSDNADGGSGDDIEQDNNGKKKKKYHRHTPQQIEKLEGLFKECPHPDEKQRLELSRALNLESRQVKFWFQNRRTQLKTQIERHENSILRQDNDKLRSENMTIREAMRNPICNNCGGPAMLADVSLEEQHLRIENARLKDELDRVSSIAGKFLGRPISSMPSPIPYSPLDLSVGSSSGGGVFAGMSNVAPTIPAVPDFLPPGAFGGVMGGSPLRPMLPMVDRPMERSLLLERALMAMDELVKMAQMEEPLWLRIPDGSGKEMLNYEEYLRMFPRCLSLRPVGYVSEISRECGVVNFNSLSLVETFMNSAHFAETFPTLIARTSTTDIISSGMGGTRDNTVQTMYAEMQALSPLVPIRQVSFVRFCKQHADGVWAVVDVSVDGIRDCPQAQGTNIVVRRQPSGCLVQDMPNGYSKVTWVEHSEYDEAGVHPLYRPMIRSGMGFGAQRWVANLQRHFESMAVLMTTILPAHDPTGMSPAGRQSMLKVAQRMTYNFCAGVCSSSAHKWKPLRVQGSIGEDVRVMTRQSVDDPGEPLGVVLSAATSVWVPLAPDRIFNFLRNEQLRSEWDILSSGVPMHEVIRIAKGHDHGNAVSLLRACAGGDNQTTMLILQESCTDASGSMVVYAPVDIPAMHVVMSGGDAAYVSLLPSGFIIVPDGVQNNGGSPASMMGGGSLLTVGFQILVNSLPTAKLTVESVTTVNNLIIRTVGRIKEALLNNIEADGV